jgi:hypothetical protein
MNPQQTEVVCVKIDMSTSPMYPDPDPEHEPQPTDQQGFLSRVFGFLFAWRTKESTNNV